MTKYYSHGVSLSKGQLEKLSRAYNNNSAITIRLTNNELSGPHELMLTKTQINKLKKVMSQRVGSDIKISKTQIGKAIKHGGSLWGSLVNLGSRLLPMAMPLVKKLLHRLQQVLYPASPVLAWIKFSERVFNREVFLFHRIKWCN